MKNPVWRSSDIVITLITRLIMMRLQGLPGNKHDLRDQQASLAPYGYRGDTRENCFEILRCCRKYDLPLLLSSDSHGPEHIGDFTCAAEFVHQAMFPEQLILNNQLPRLKVFLQTREWSSVFFRQITAIVTPKQNRPVQTQEYTFSCIWTDLFLFFPLLPYNFRKLAIFTCNISEVLSSVRKLAFGAVFDPAFRKAKITTTFISQCI